MSNPKNTRQVKDIISVLKKKGFELNPEKDHHQYYFLFDKDGKKTHIYTYISNGESECNNFILGQIKKQLKFKERDNFEKFLNCPMSYEMYLRMLTEDEEL